MRPRPDAPAPLRGFVRADEVGLYSEVARRLGLCAKSRRAAKRAGLRTIRFGRWEYVLGADVLDFFRRLAERQASDGNQAGNGDGGPAHE